METRPTIKLFEQSATPGSIIKTNNSNIPEYLAPGTIGQVLTTSPTLQPIWSSLIAQNGLSRLSTGEFELGLNPLIHNTVLTNNSFNLDHVGSTYINRWNPNGGLSLGSTAYNGTLNYPLQINPPTNGSSILFTAGTGIIGRQRFEGTTPSQLYYENGTSTFQYSRVSPSNDFRVQFAMGGTWAGTIATPSGYHKFGVAPVIFTPATSTHNEVANGAYNFIQQGTTAPTSVTPSNPIGGRTVISNSRGGFRLTDYYYSLTSPQSGLTGGINGRNFWNWYMETDGRLHMSAGAQDITSGTDPTISNKVTFTQNGKVGIGIVNPINAPTTLLEVNGNAVFNGTLYLSDIRNKYDIQPVMEKNIQGFTLKLYKFKYIQTGIEATGYIAQEVESFLQHLNLDVELVVKYGGGYDWEKRLDKMNKKYNTEFVNIADFLMWANDLNIHTTQEIDDIIDYYNQHEFQVSNFRSLDLNALQSILTFIQ